MKSGHPLWGNLFRTKDDWVDRAAELCARNPLFEGLTPASIRWLTARMHPRHHAAGEMIFRMGNPGVGAVLILEGEVQIEAGGVELARLGAGDLFGEVSLVSDQPRTANAKAVSDCELVFFLRSDLQEWMDSRPRRASQLLRNLAAMLATRLLEANRRLGETNNP